jgi:hypothetical protein
MARYVFKRQVGDQKLKVIRLKGVILFVWKFMIRREDVNRHCKVRNPAFKT